MPKYTVKLSDDGKIINGMNQKGLDRFWDLVWLVNKNRLEYRSPKEGEEESTEEWTRNQWNDIVASTSRERKKKRSIDKIGEHCRMEPRLKNIFVDEIVLESTKDNVESHQRQSAIASMKVEV